MGAEYNAARSDAVAKALAGLSAKEIGAVTLAIVGVTVSTPLALKYKGGAGGGGDDEDEEQGQGTDNPGGNPGPDNPGPDKPERGPEPATGVLSIVALPALAARRRRKRATA